MAKARSTKQKPRPIDVLKGIGLEEIDAEIAEHEAEIARHKAEVDSLKTVRRAVDVAVNGKRPRAARGSKKKAAAAGSNVSTSGNGSLAPRIKQYLERQQPASISALAESLKVPAADVSACCKGHPDEFSFNPRGGGGN